MPAVVVQAVEAASSVPTVVVEEVAAVVVMVGDEMAQALGFQGLP